jgi:oxygen-independent coproporphyrinogen-3 oxidase
MNDVSQIAKTLDLEKRVPRYTSYPPANHFNGSVTGESFSNWIAAIPKASRISLYLHIPFCRNLCWFCACRTQGIKRRFDALYHYIDGLKIELDHLAAQLDPSVIIKTIHLGGGTPTLLPPPLITDLMQYVKDRFTLDEDYGLSVEIDPTEIDQERIDALVKSGLSRASVGVQDFKEEIQQAIGRPQSYEQTQQCFDHLRAAKINSINIDLLYGLPHQTLTGFSETIDRVLSLSPDRVAMFGYAHVPWMAKRQQLIDPATLPDSALRLALLEKGRQRFMDNGYLPIGIDHFAKPDDSLARAAENGQLHRNFQGYTDDASRILIGLGASAISIFPQGYAQNASGTQAYLEHIQHGKFATSRGHVFSDDDHLRRYIIDQLMCSFELSLTEMRARFGDQAAALCQSIEQNADKMGLTRHGSEAVYRIAEPAHLTARMVAQQFDQYQAPEKSHSLAV